MNVLLQQADELLETAICAEEKASGLVILMDRMGGMRILDASGWTSSGLNAEFGPSALFQVNKRLGVASVEAWSGHDHCLVERQTQTTRLPCLALAPAVCHPIRLHMAPLSIEESYARDSEV